MPDDAKPEQNNNTAPESESAEEPDNSEPKKTGMLELSDDQVRPMPKRQAGGATTRLNPGWKLVFHISDTRVVLPVDKEIIVGRSSESSDSQIDFDLTPHGAYHFGVSRRHALITLSDGQLYIEDLGSTNGTRINGFQLTAHQKYRLRDEDELEFARLRTSIRFRNPTSDS
jgi:pSer/pThr/pTyr-binding forkhead associated (FHA) protein